MVLDWSYNYQDNILCQQVTPKTTDLKKKESISLMIKFVSHFQNAISSFFGCKNEKA